MNSKLRQKAIDLRVKKELSYSEIKRQLGVSKSTLSYWLKEYPLSERKIKELRKKGWEKGEVSRERFRNTMRRKQEAVDKKILKKYLAQFKRINNDSYFIAGLMLYLGEGDKKNRARIGLANTDPFIIIFFIEWLQRFLKTPKEKIRIQLHLYEAMNIKKETRYWQKVTKIPLGQFYKIQVRKRKKNSFSYEGSQSHGTCSIFVSSTEKKREIMMAIKAFSLRC
tara:strand:- start:9345 stop:10016 length:672 start_codon:yes stop_codon:yes gene_type:complete